MDKYKNVLLEFKQFLQRGETLGLPLRKEIQKVDSLIESISDAPIKIALAGSFCDGKTSVIAGLLGKVTSEMDISQDESTNQLRYYHLSDGVHKYDIVDTPGLFGNKSDMDDNGDKVRYSDKTKAFISSADILMYVCEATNPLKDSHKKSLFHILRDFNKLNSSIFVINKMDEVSELADDDFAENAKIKTDTFRQRLNDMLHLNDDELSRLRVVCIAANPFGRGVKTWLENPDAYEQYSHIDSLKKAVSDILDVKDNAETRHNTFEAELKDLVSALLKEILQQCRVFDNPISRFRHELDDLQKQTDDTRARLLENRTRMIQELDDKHTQLIKDINSALELQDLNNIIETQIGMDGEENVDCNKLKVNINNIMSKYVENNDNEIKAKSVDFRQVFENQDNFFKSQAAKGIKYIGNVNVSGEQIKRLRDIFAKDKKFKPWGAINLGKKVTKGFKLAGKALEKLRQGYEIYQQWHESKLFDDTKRSMKNSINQIFSDLNKNLQSDKDYFENYAHGYLLLQKSLDERKQQLEDMQRHCEDLYCYRQSLTDWFGEDIQIEDAEYEDVL